MLKKIVVVFLIIPCLVLAQKHDSLIVDNTEKPTKLTRGEVIVIMGMCGLLQNVNGIQKAATLNAGEESTVVAPIVEKLQDQISALTDSSKKFNLYFTANEARACAMLLSRAVISPALSPTNEAIKTKLALLYVNSVAANGVASKKKK